MTSAMFAAAHLTLRLNDVAGAADTSTSDSRADLASAHMTKRYIRVLRGMLICGIAVGLWALVWLAVGDAIPQHLERFALVPAALFFVGMTAVFWHERRWAAPARRLQETLMQIRAGETPIETLSQITGPLSSVSEEARRILHDHRLQEKDLAELQAEMSQRVAGRTDALERVIGSLRQQATRDPLTGLFNRRLLDQQLPELIAHCRAGGADLAILMIDVDHFKHLNDTLGHAAGDELLRSIAQIIRSSVREQDCAYRCGGDEFVIVMPDADGEASRAASARLTSLVDALARTLKVVTPPRLSIGISQLSALRDATPERLLRHADAMLYRLKYAGRKTARVRPFARAG